MKALAIAVFLSFTGYTEAQDCIESANPLGKCGTCETKQVLVMMLNKLCPQLADGKTFLFAAFPCPRLQDGIPLSEHDRECTWRLSEGNMREWGIFVARALYFSSTNERHVGRASKSQWTCRTNGGNVSTRVTIHARAASSSSAQKIPYSQV